MSIEHGTADWEPSDALDSRLDQPRELRFPADWTLSESWERAQREHDRGGPLDSDAERIVWLETGDPHRVVFALSPYGTARAHTDGQKYVNLGTRLVVQQHAEGREEPDYSPVMSGPNTAYVAVPIELVQALGLQQGFEVQRAYHPETGCFINCLRDDYDLFAEHR